MRFSFIGLNSISQPLADAIAAHPVHELAVLHAVEDLSFRQQYPAAQWREDWESVLHNTDSEIVIISPANDLDTQEDRLRRVLQCELPAIAVQPYCGVLAAFEMAMIQAQTGQPLISYVPADHHPLSRTLADWIADPATSPIGTITQVTIKAHPDTMCRDDVLQGLAYDVPIVRNLTGRIRQVSAMSSTLEDGRFVSLNVSLKTDSPALVTWTLDQSATRGQRKLLLAGSQGNLTLSLLENHAIWQVSGEAVPELACSPSPSPASLFLDRLTEILATPNSDESWLAWCQDLEVAEAVPICLRRERTIDILDEERTEEGSFKGVMSIGGCGLLLTALLFLLVGCIIEAFLLPARRHTYELNKPSVDSFQPAPVPKRSLWIRLWPVYPLLLFLLLQFLKLVIQNPDRHKTAAESHIVRQRGPPS